MTEPDEAEAHIEVTVDLHIDGEPSHPGHDPPSDPDDDLFIEVTLDDDFADSNAVLRRVLPPGDADRPSSPPPRASRPPRASQPPPVSGADRRRGVRYGTVVKVTVVDGPLDMRCRGLEISSSGIVLDWRRPRRSLPELMKLKLHVPDRDEPLELLARSVWHRGRIQGLRFVPANDDERLAIAEAVDTLHRAGLLY